MSGEIISEGEGPVLYGGDGSVIYEDGTPMMGDPDGFVSQRRAMEDYWNSPASDRGYPCYPVWLPLRDHLYFRGDYLLWWAKGSTVIPPQQSVTLSMNDGSRSGARFTLGYWIDLCRWRGLEATYLTLDTRGDQYVAGNFTVNATSNFDGLEALFRKALIARGCNRFDMLLGYRTVRLRDDFMGLWDPGPFRWRYDIRTKNRFNGFELGFAGKNGWRRWTLDMEMKLALGSTHTAVSMVHPNAQFTGDYSFDNFAVISELGATLGYHITRRLRATVGYTFLYWSMLARPGDQLAQAGQFRLSTTDYWTQGLNFGLEWQF